jgi:hypothetical protein
MCVLYRVTSLSRPVLRAGMVGVVVVAVLSAVTAEAARPRRRGPSPAQVKKMKEEMEYRQREIMRVQSEVAAKEREVFQKFDENGDGRLLGPERSKYDKHLYEIRTGKAPNPLADIKPLGQGPRDSKAGSSKK